MRTREEILAEWTEWSGAPDDPMWEHYSDSKEIKAAKERRILLEVLLDVREAIVSAHAAFPVPDENGIIVGFAKSVEEAVALRDGLAKWGRSEQTCVRPLVRGRLG